jgi:isopenicillin N synthase-like dioxygenase
VSTAPPRDCNNDEIPIIDISGIYGDADARTELAAQFKSAAVGTGFFYIKNHGIDEEIIKTAEKQALK